MLHSGYSSNSILEIEPEKVKAIEEPLRSHPGVHLPRPSYVGLNPDPIVVFELLTGAATDRFIIAIDGVSYWNLICEARGKKSWY